MAMWPGKASSPTFGKPREPDAIRTPGPYSTRCVLNPLRCTRVVVSRFTSPTEPSYGTVCMNVYALSPGSALTSGKIFSDVSKSSVPASGRWITSDFATAPPLGRRTDAHRIRKWMNHADRRQNLAGHQDDMAYTIGNMRIVVAVGGNAIVKAGEAGTWDEERREWGGNAGT